jgi:hypothetical protein
MKVIFFLILFTTQVFSQESMKEMVQLNEDHLYIVTGDEDFLKLMGFGAEDQKINMMNLMMVEGSGYEGMEHH